MKKTATVLMGVALVLILLLSAGNFYFSRVPVFNDPWPADPALAPFFKETYDDSRTAFKEACRDLAAKIPGTQSLSFDVHSKRAQGLTIDTCRVPSAKNDRVLIVTAGIHGGEGYASAAVERYLMRSLPARNPRPEILLVHGINAFGMKFFRRVTENNVDLNRNFDTKPDLFQEKNEGYVQVSPLLNPEGPAGLSSPTHRLFALRAIYNIVSKGMGKLRQAVLQGQYQFPKGIYYGGNAFEQQRAILEGLFTTAAAGKTLAVIVDLHTGYGERGICHLFPNPPPNKQVRDLTNTLFAGYRIDWGDQGDFYTIHGDFTEYVGRIMPAGVRFVPMTFEFGTMNSQTTKGSIDSIHTTILENQSYQFGCVSAEDCDEIKRRYREMFYPSSPSWRSKVLRDADDLFGKTIERMMTI